MSAPAIRLSYREDIDRDKPLSFHWRVDVEQLRLDFPQFPRFASTKTESAAAAIMADALLVAASDNPERRISYSRSRDWYSDGERYRGSDYTYGTVLAAVEALLEAGLLIDHDRRLPKTGGSGVQSSFRASTALVGRGTAKKVRRARLAEIIVLKDVRKQRIGYKDTVRTRRARKDLEKVNAAISAADITLAAPNAVIEGDIARFGDHTVYLSMKEAYRVFNNGVWTDGGRVYGTWWQQMKSEDRQYILIDGETVVEIDFEQLHPRLMYAKAGVAYEGDAYTIPGWTDPTDPVRHKELRDLCKRAWNILLNASSWNEAVAAMTDYTDGRKEVAQELLNDIRRHHSAIRKFFHSGMGLRFQAIDGEMCMEILKEMTVRRGIPCLSVHDSFIVAAEHRETLAKVMSAALEKGMRRVSAKPCATRVSGFPIRHMEALSPAGPAALAASGAAHCDSYGAANSESDSESPYGAADSESLASRYGAVESYTADTDAGDGMHDLDLTNSPDAAEPEMETVGSHGDVPVGVDTGETSGDTPRPLPDASTHMTDEDCLTTVDWAELMKPPSMKDHLERLSRTSGPALSSASRQDRLARRY